MKVPTWLRTEPNEEMLRVSNVPERKWGAELKRVKGDSPYLAEVRGYLGKLRENIEAGDGLLLWGPYRSGKSCLAACVVREVAAHRCRAYWLEAFALVDGWLAGEDDLRRRMVEEAYLLVVDDLGTEGSMPLRRELVETALRLRMERRGATVITTNLSPDQLEAYYGAKLSALLRECVRPIKVAGVDWNKEAGR